MKGTLTPLSSIFSADEAQKASKRILGAISDHRKELDTLNSHIADNNNLVSLVQRIPDELHHDVMVPFGKAAFFPGRLIHTNEFLVLLGEGYYAERTSKQTVEVLKRRGKSLESNADSLKAMMKDLKAEASFFDDTAAEAAEGLVEIREELDEQNSSGEVPKTDFTLSKANNKRVDDEDEYAHIMSRFDELEKEELAAESLSECDRVAKTEADFGPCTSQQSVHHDCGSSKLPSQQLEDECGIAAKIAAGKHNESSESIVLEDSMSRSACKDDVNKSSSAGMVSTVPDVIENFEAVSAPTNEVVSRTKKPKADSLKAFTGSVVEHSQDLQTNSSQQGTNVPRPSKPISIFKLRRK